MSQGIFHRLRQRLPLSLLIGSIGWVAAAFGAPLSEEPSRVVYQVYVRAFYDGYHPTGGPDGEGDLAGLVEKIPYFEDLGVDTLLLMPIFASTGDMGYIPRDYSQLDPAYGDLAGFGEFISLLGNLSTLYAQATI